MTKLAHDDNHGTMPTLPLRRSMQRANVTAVLPQAAVAVDEVSTPEVELRSRRASVALVCAFLLGAGIRARYLFASGGFPLRDGGMFYVMTQELVASHFRLPSSTAYNAANIPFDYPPLGFYVSGLLASVLHASLLRVLWLLPFGVSIATIAAFYTLARTLLRSSTATIVATFAFAALPGAFFLTIAGGGITRAFGFLFGILALNQLVLMYRKATAWRMLAATVCLALALLSHPEAPLFLAVSATLLFLFYGRTVAGLLQSLLVLVGGMLFSAPWWATALARHGLTPFVHAAHAGSAGLLSIVSGALILSLMNVTLESFFPLVLASALLGLVGRSSEDRRFLSCWVLAIALFATRGIGQYETVPLALLAGVGVVHVLLPLLAGAEPGAASIAGTDEYDMRPNGTSRTALLREMRAATWRSGVRGPVRLFFAIALLYVTMSAAMSAPTTLSALSREDREAMSWVASNTPTTSTFLVLDPDPLSESLLTGGADRLIGQDFDDVSEWFPALSGRVSVATPQGREWTAGNFQVVIRRYLDAKLCLERDSGCLETWSRESDTLFDYVYIAKKASVGEDTCCPPLLASMRADKGFRLVYDGPGATLFERQVVLPSSQIRP